VTVDADDVRLEVWRDEDAVSGGESA